MPTLPHALALAVLTLPSTALPLFAAGSAIEPAPAADAGQLGILTPAAGPAPKITGPKIYGERPGKPFLYSIPATGDRPITFAADGLPAGLQLDAATGRITGSVASPGKYKVTLHAANAAGKDKKAFRIVIGDKIALTPPMGWNSWNCWGSSVSQDKVLSSAHAFIDKKLDQHGWTYVNIDDGWQGPRGGDHNAIQPNPKFPDLKGLAGQVHALGLKFGIYSTPWTTSYAGFVGGSANNARGATEWITSGSHDSVFHFSQADYEAKYGRKAPWGGLGTVSFARNDAAQWAAWGVDYLKYDWNPIDVTSTEDPMTDALRASGRDIVYSPLQPGADRAGRRLGAPRQFLAHHRRHHRHLEKHDRHRPQPDALARLRRPGPLERSRHAHRRRGRLGQSAPDGPHAQRAIFPRLALEPAGRAVAHRLRPVARGRLHAEPADQRRGARRRPGFPRRRSAPGLPRQQRGHLRAAARRRLGRRRPVQYHHRSAHHHGDVERPQACRPAARARPLAPEQPRRAGEAIHRRRGTTRRRARARDSAREVVAALVPRSQVLSFQTPFGNVFLIPAKLRFAEDKIGNGVASTIAFPNGVWERGTEFFRKDPIW
ncbi:MAG: putative Ig domain-containing protein [Verrucomicrobiota bacterium]